jgi:hypothetical protein
MLSARMVAFNKFSAKDLHFLGDLCTSLLSGGFNSVNEYLYTFVCVKGMVKTLGGTVKVLVTRATRHLA